MKVNIHIIRPEIVPDVWPVIWPLLEPALADDFMHDEQSLKAMLLTDEAMLLNATVDGAIKGAVVLKIENQKSRIAYVCYLGGRDFPEWGEKMNESLERIARESGCRYVMGHGTKAWQRVMKDFKPGKTLYYKEVA